MFDESVPGSVINSVPKSVSQKIYALQKGSFYEELHVLDEPRLKKRLAELGYRPTQAENCLRFNFWFEYNAVKASGPPYLLDITRICGQVCSREFFYKFFLENELALVWMLCPPMNYAQALNEAILFGVGELREVLSLDTNDQLSRVNMKIGALRILGELSGQLRIGKNGPKAIKTTKQKADHVEETVKALTEADLEARRILIEKKIQMEQERSKK